MKDYLVCILFWIIFTIILYMFGKAVGKSKSVSGDFITGYLIYSFFVAVGAIPMQLADLPWMLFAIYMGILWIGMAGIILYTAKRKKVGFYAINIKKYIMENWFLYVICIIVIFMLAFCYAGFWLGNHLDDGYYVTKVATMPYTQIGGNYNYSVGIPGTGISSYIVNTWEIEASVYVKLLGVAPTLYLRLFQSAFYYFLFANIIKWLAEYMFERSGANSIPRKMAQYTTAIIPLISTYYLYLSNSRILVLRDMFFLQSGMFLGATMVRLCGISIFIILYLKYGIAKQTVHMVISYIVVSVVLVSKSTIALPIILISFFSAGIVWLVCEYGRKERIIGVLLAIGYIVVGVILPNNTGIAQVVKNDITNSLTSLALYPFILIFVCSFLLKNKIIYKLNAQFILMVLLIITSECNDVFELCSVYDFVGGRAWTAVVYYFIVLNMGHLCYMLYKIVRKNVLPATVSIGLSVVFMAVMLRGFAQNGGEILPDNPAKKADMKNCLRVIKNNKYFIPSSTILLGDELEKLTDETENQLCVVMPKLVVDNDALHSLAVSIRAYAPDIISAAAMERYTMSNNSALSEYKQVNYDAFVANPNQENADKLERELDGTGVNCIVTQSPNYEEWFDGMGYVLKASTEDGRYFIWYKAE